MDEQTYAMFQQFLNDPRFVARVRQIAESTPPAGRKTLIDENWQPNDSTIAWCKTVGLTVSQVSIAVAYFVTSCQSKGYKYADFQAAFRNSVTKNWAGLEKGQSTDTALDAYRAGRA